MPVQLALHRSHLKTAVSSRFITFFPLALILASVSFFLFSNLLISCPIFCQTSQAPEQNSPFLRSVPNPLFGTGSGAPEQLTAQTETLKNPVSGCFFSEVGVRCLSLPKQVPAILYLIQAGQEKAFDNL